MVIKREERRWFGSWVAIYPALPCLKGRYCELKRYNLCLDIKEIGSTLDLGCAESIRITKEIVQIGGLVAVPDRLSDEEESLIEPLACCPNGFSQINGPLGKDSSVAIIGDGPIGLLYLQLSKNSLSTRTVVIGKTPERMAAAKCLGADKVFSADNHQASEILQSNGRSGHDLIVVATSEPSAMDLAAKIASKGVVHQHFCRY